MKVNQYGNISNNPYKHQLNKQNELQSQPVKKDQLQISKEALEMHKNNGVTKDRAEKIEHLKNEIESGNYQVDSGKVAKKFLDFWTKS